MGQLPQIPQVTEKAYDKTVTIGYKLTKAYFSGNYVSEDEKSSMSGMIGEIAVLALLQRFAIREIGSNTFSPILSMLREDRRNNHGSTINHGWDISVFTQLGRAKPILNYRVQVKTFEQDQSTKPKIDEARISRVVINPDLQVRPGDRYVACNIVNECFRELTDRWAPDTLTDRLDDRTTSLLEYIDA